MDACNANLGICTTDLSSCNADLEACEAGAQVFPGDGYANPDAFGVSGHGPALSYTDNGDGTFTDDNTGFMWKKKDDAGGIHDKDNTYTWSDNGNMDNTDPDGTLFTVFLDTLNTTCDGAGVTDCVDDSVCGAGACGFAGYQDWCIPNIKKLQSIVDYGTPFLAFSVPGQTAPSLYWSATTIANFSGDAWGVGFNKGFVGGDGKGGFNVVRAVRPCS